MHPDETISPKAHFHSEISLDISPHDIYTSSNDCIVQNDDDYKQRRLYDGNSNGRGGSCFWYSHLRSTLKRTSAQIFRRKTLHKRLPIVKWLPAYNRADFVGDLMAGITVGLTVIPQGLAYASIAGVDLQVKHDHNSVISPSFIFCYLLPGNNNRFQTLILVRLIRMFYGMFHLHVPWLKVIFIFLLSCKIITL